MQRSCAGWPIQTKRVRLTHLDTSHRAATRSSSVDQLIRPICPKQKKATRRGIQDPLGVAPKPFIALRGRNYSNPIAAHALIQACHIGAS